MLIKKDWHILHASPFFCLITLPDKTAIPCIWAAATVRSVHHLLEFVDMVANFIEESGDRIVISHGFGSFAVDFISHLACTDHPDRQVLDLGDMARNILYQSDVPRR